MITSLNIKNVFHKAFFAFKNYIVIFLVFIQISNPFSRHKYGLNYKLLYLEVYINVFECKCLLTSFKWTIRFF